MAVPCGGARWGCHFTFPCNTNIHYRLLLLHLSNLHLTNSLPEVAVGGNVFSAFQPVACHNKAASQTCGKMQVRRAASFLLAIITSLLQPLCHSQTTSTATTAPPNHHFTPPLVIRGLFDSGWWSGGLPLLWLPSGVGSPPCFLFFPYSSKTNFNLPTFQPFSFLLPLAASPSLPSLPSQSEHATATMSPLQAAGDRHLRRNATYNFGGQLSSKCFCDTNFIQPLSLEANVWLFNEKFELKRVGF